MNSDEVGLCVIIVFILGFIGTMVALGLAQQHDLRVYFIRDAKESSCEYLNHYLEREAPMILKNARYDIYKDEYNERCFTD